MENTTAIAKVNHVDILVIQSKKLVPIKPLCDIMGVDYQLQLVKFKIDPVLGPIYTVEVFTNDGTTYEMVTLPIKYIFWWLAKLEFTSYTQEVNALKNPAQLYVYEVLWDYYNSYQEYLEFRNGMIQEQITIRDAAKIEFDYTKEKMIDAEHEMKRRLSLTFEDFLQNRKMKLDFGEGPK